MDNPLIVFLDTETTGLTEKDRLVQISYKVWKTNEAATELFRPPEGVELSFEATSVHHITRKMIEDKALFESSEMKIRLEELFNMGAIMVAHNAVFDMGIIAQEGLKPPKYICTLKIARFLDQKAELSQHKLQYLRYAFDLDIEATAHDAGGDVLVLEKLFEFFSKELTIDKMVEISAKPSFIRKFSFGKYKGKFVDEVLKEDREYLEWFLETKKKDDPLNEDWIYTLTEVLKK